MPTTIVSEHDGSTRYYDDDQRLHRIGAPAVENVDGSTRWYVNGECHRIDGPALEDPKYGEHLWIVHHQEVRRATHVLDELYSAGDTDTLSHVLSVWAPEGPDVDELLRAIRAAGLVSSAA